jgi:hypothetical protein
MRAPSDRASTDALRAELDRLWTATKFDHDAVLRVVAMLKEQVGGKHGKEAAVRLGRGSEIVAGWLPGQPDRRWPGLSASLSALLMSAPQWTERIRCATPR